MSKQCLEIFDIILFTYCLEEINKKYLARVVLENFSRDKNPESHFCVYFLPYNPETKEVFLVHHKKSNLWLSPGGHIDKEETPIKALIREAKEELGIEINHPEDCSPFLLTVTKIPERPNTKCKEHFDIWYLIKTDGKNFNIDMSEFFNAHWLSIPKAREIVIDKQNLEAFAQVEKIFK